jgi:O-antigen/teichoic acid export membrane protein
MVDDRSGESGPTMPIDRLRLIQNGVLLLGGQVLAQVCAAGLGILIARSLGAAEYGRYSFAFAFSGALALLFGVGLDAIVVRDVASSPSRSAETVASGLWLRLACLPFVLVGVVAGREFGAYDDKDAQLIILVCVTAGLSSLSDLPRAAMQGLQRSGFDLLTRAVEKLIPLLIALFFALNSSGLHGIMMAVVFGTSVSVIITWIMLIRDIGPMPLRVSNRVISLALSAAPISLSGAVIAVYQRLPTLALGIASSFEDVSRYSVASSLVTPFTLIPVALCGALLPVVTPIIRKDMNQFRNIHVSIINGLLAFSMPIMILVYNLFPSLSVTVYGPEFVEAGDTIRILSIAVPIVFTTTYFSNILIASGHQWVLFSITIINLVFMSLGILVLIPAMGAPGAAITAVVTEFGGLAMLLVMTQRLVRTRPNRRLLGIALSAVCMQLAILGVRPWSIWLVPPAGLAAYVLGLVASRAISLREWRRLVESHTGQPTAARIPDGSDRPTAVT